MEAAFKSCHYEKDQFIAYVTNERLECNASHFGKTVFILVTFETDVHYLIEIVNREYVAICHSYYLHDADVSCYSCVSANQLCHVGALNGFKHNDGVLVSLNSKNLIGLIHLACYIKV